MKIRATFIFISQAMISLPAMAYVGPGMAGGVIASTLGFLGAIFLLLFGIIYYPLKRALKNRKKNQHSPDQEIDKKRDIDAKRESTEESDG